MTILTAPRITSNRAREADNFGKGSVLSLERVRTSRFTLHQAPGKLSQHRGLAQRLQTLFDNCLSRRTLFVNLYITIAAEVPHYLQSRRRRGLFGETAPVLRRMGDWAQAVRPRSWPDSD